MIGMIERRYNKPSKHKYWKIIIEWSGLWSYPWNVDLVAYGISSGKGTPKLGLFVHGNSAMYVGKTREEVITIGEELVIKEMYKFTKDRIKWYDNLKKKELEREKTEYENKICKILAEFERDITGFKKHLDDPLIIKIQREEKLKRISNV